MAGALIRFFIAAIFILSGVQKLSEPPENFAYIIEGYKVLSHPHSLLLAKILPWAEWIFGALLLTGFKIKQAAAGIAFMCTVFIVATAQAMLRGIDLTECGCFGELIHIPPPVILGVDCLMLTAAVFWFFKPSACSKWSLDRVGT